jgi:hypothetical protein
MGRVDERGKGCGVPGGGGVCDLIRDPLQNGKVFGQEPNHVQIPIKYKSVSNLSLYRIGQNVGTLEVERNLLVDLDQAFDTYSPLRGAEPKDGLASGGLPNTSSSYICQPFITPATQYT